jgi:hypothetical protein
MQIPEFDRSRRSVLLAQREKLMKQYIALDEKLSPDQKSEDPRQKALATEMRKIAEEMGQCRQEYDHLIPRIKVSECPFTGEPLIIAFDPVALDGFWWMEFTRRIYEGQTRPETFRVIRGAVNFRRLPPQGGRHEALIGPEVPYVIPRILQLPTMEMVISCVTLENGYVAYPMAYFSTESPEPGKLTSPWLWSNEYIFRDANGRERWLIPNDPWDFNIGKWVERGKVRWMNPDGQTLAPASTNPADCPYVDLEGCRLPQILKDNKITTEPLPDPTVEMDPFD